MRRVGARLRRQAAIGGGAAQALGEFQQRRGGTGGGQPQDAGARPVSQPVQRQREGRDGRGGGAGPGADAGFGLGRDAPQEQQREVQVGGGGEAGGTAGRQPALQGAQALADGGARPEGEEQTATAAAFVPLPRHARRSRRHVPRQVRRPYAAYGAAAVTRPAIAAVPPARSGMSGGAPRRGRRRSVCAPRGAPPPATARPGIRRPRDWRQCRPRVPRRR